MLGLGCGRREREAALTDGLDVRSASVCSADSRETKSEDGPGMGRWRGASSAETLQADMFVIIRRNAGQTLHCVVVLVRRPGHTLSCQGCALITNSV